jgi:hypothetical protein
MLPNAPRRGGERARSLHWCYVPISKGESCHCYIAGPSQWFAVHPSSRTKPCLHELTGGEIACELCAAGKIATVKGYVPLYRQSDGKPIVVLVDEVSRDTLDVLPFLTRVVVMREKTVGSAVSIGRAPVQTPIYESTLPERKKPGDLTNTLLAMWKIPELTLWYRTTHGVGDNPVSMPRADHGVPAGGGGVGGGAGGGDGGGAHLLGDSFMGALPAETRNAIYARRAREAEVKTNGVHKPSKK